MTAPQPGDYAGVDFDFALGEIYGLRVWRQDECGRLRSRHLENVPPWRPGLNTAKCFASLAGGMGGFLNTVYGSLAPAVAALGVPDEHTVPVEACRCGFYAYTQETFESFETGGVIGVIRGSGRTLIGTKGFRCEKAAIVAVLDPRADDRVGYGSVARWQWEKLRRLYPDIPVLGSRTELLDFAPIEWTEPKPSDPDFWTVP